MHLKKLLSVTRGAVLCATTLAAASALATQTVEPTLTAGGASINGSTQNVPAGSTFTFYGMYSDDVASPESGLGLKVKYNGTHLTNVTVSEEYTKCRIAAADVQNPATATAQAVMGWIDTSIRPSGVVASATGAVGWPNLADLTSGGCLNPGSINGAANAGDNAGTPAATAASPLKLFKITGTMAASCTSAAACTSSVTLTSDGNYSYANGGSSGFANKSFTIQGAPAAAIMLAGGGSLKVHGNGIGDKVVNVASINGTAPSAAADGGSGISVEPRAGATTTAVMTFNAQVTSFATVSVVSCRQWTGTVAAACTSLPTVGAAVINPSNTNQILIPLSGIVDQSRVLISVATVNGSMINAQMAIGFLAGDINGDGVIDGVDVSNVQTRVAQSQSVNASPTAFRADVNGDGVLDGTDVSNIMTRNSKSKRLP